MPAQPSKKLNKDNARFPRISRFITERSIRYAKYGLFGLIGTILIVLTMLKLVELRTGLITIQAQSAQHTELLAQMGYWEGVLKRHPGYRDAAFKLATLSYQLGLKDQAKNYIDLTLKIDPNFQQGRTFLDKM